MTNSHHRNKLMAALFDEHDDERTPERTLSPGPMRMSELEPTSRKLEPISPVKKKKRHRKKRSATAKERRPDDIERSPQPVTSSLIDSNLIHQLRTRLDPIYNPPTTTTTPDHGPLHTSEGDDSNRGIDDSNQTQHRPSPNLEHESLESTSREVLIGESERVRHKKTRKRRKRERGSERTVANEEESQIRGEAEGKAEMVSSRLEDERSVDIQDEPQPDVDESRSCGRELPIDPQGVLEASGPTMADELENNRLQPNIHPDDPQMLVSEEDITEDDLEQVGLQYTLPSLQGQVLSRQTNDVIFIERRDGRGFVAKRKGEENGTKEESGLVRGTSSSEFEISSAEFAVYAHKAVQHLAFTAHGLVAGISLWDCIVSNVLSLQSNHHVDLLTSYHSLTLPVHSVYVFLLSAVLLSLLDRFDFAHFDKNYLLNLIRSPSQIFLFISSFLVTIALILTLSVAAIDERIALYPNQPSLWTDLLLAINTSLPSSQVTPLPPTHIEGSLVYVPGDNLISSRLRAWLALAIVRAVCCCASWIVAIWFTEHDRLLDYLQDSCSDDHHGSQTVEHTRN